MNGSKSQHNYGIDLLRIAAMLMIVAHHFSLHSGISFEPGSGNDILMQILALGGKTGVNIFILITGFYSSGRVRHRKILDLIGCSMIYSIVLTVAAIMMGSVGISKKLLLKAAVPLLFGDTYWFITTYLELYILIPVLNIATEKLSKNTYRNYLILFTALLCILPKVAGCFIHVNDLGYNALVWFVYLYFLGAYLKRSAVPGKNTGLAALICIFVQAAASVMLQLGTIGGGLGKLLACAADYSLNAPLPLLIAVLMLIWFQSLNVNRGRKLISLLGSATLGVYLFHDNVNFRGVLWQCVFGVCEGSGTWPFAVSALLSILTVMVLGFAVELLRTGVMTYLRSFVRRNRAGE